ncbi:MAG: hypothetical protein AB7O39_15215 [Flavobacteriaceae bacterium]
MPQLLVIIIVAVIAIWAFRFLRAEQRRVGKMLDRQDRLRRPGGGVDLVYDEKTGEYRPRGESDGS